MYLSAGAPPGVRRRGAVEPLAGTSVLNGSSVRAMVLGMLTRSERERFEAARQLTTTYSGQGRYRVSMFLQRGTVAAVFRLVPAAPPTLERLGLPESVRLLPAAEAGLVVVSGPRRSGVSTTLAAIVASINVRRAVHVVTVEDPVEFTYASQESTIHQIEVGRDTADFVLGVDVALRSAPDVLLAGRIGDPATARLAVDAAEAGVLVVAGMPAPTAVAAVERLIALALAPMARVVRDQLANCLQAVVAQQLVPARGGNLALAAEVLIGSSTVRAFIREGRTEQLAAAMGVGSDGMQTMEQSLARLVTIGSIPVETAEERCAHPEEVRRLVRSSAPPAPTAVPEPAVPRERLVR